MVAAACFWGASRQLLATVLVIGFGAQIVPYSAMLAAFLFGPQIQTINIHS